MLPFHWSREGSISGMTLLIPEHSIPFTAKKGTPQKEKQVVDWCSGIEKEEKSQVCLEQVKFPGTSKRLGPAAHAELTIDVAEMLFHGACSDAPTAQ
jgi:hypothetical protein